MWRGHRQAHTFSLSTNAFYALRLLSLLCVMTSQYLHALLLCVRYTPLKLRGLLAELLTRLGHTGRHAAVLPRAIQACVLARIVRAGFVS